MTVASHAPDFGRASALPLSAVLASIPSYPRPVIERLVARLIDHLDEQDGDADLEPNGDELEDCEGQTFVDEAGRFYGEPNPTQDFDGDAEPDEPEWATVRGYGIDQRIASVGHGYRPWHIDAEQPL